MVNRDRNIEDKDITCQTEFFKVHQRSHRFKHSVEPAINQGPLITVTSKFESPSIPSSIDLPIKDIQEPIDSCFESCEKQSISEDTVDTLTSKTLPLDSTFDDEHHSNPLLPIHDRLCIGFGRQTYALAGALSGTFVSICLHPIDTVKTVIQSRSMNQVSIFQAFASVISERGLMGLYRGIASNLASSAPTSAIYTFTYETVKSAMLPILPKEYYSLAHCTAGGCASIATSFIFTPSDRVKQQMQVRSHYQNCWNALIGILEKGGLRSLYAGWGAVLCRNVPHSAIKFYTYERLKLLLLPLQTETNPNTMQTLFCGGLAGTTAALFTTPFDVVKTRFQTEVPGSLTQYAGVFHTLQQIAKHEGLRGLYRGLTPRLVMYVSQGAIFFASYEFFKTVLSLDVSSVLPAKVIDNKIKIEDD
ncbi:putative Mitochondrial carrier protein [Zostera marina]|uniref:Putative Mitochondrial carrier protein n=1 Tax=Zostera marina TaxID=29655 RepID=A0A0K9PV12_ZOSMR|nr:putative Mitochondrial carrier protein [Zostera marina]